MPPFQQEFPLSWGYKNWPLALASQVALVVKNLPANAGDIRDTGLIPGLGRSPGWWHGNPPQYSCLENPMDRGTWRATVHKVAKSWTWPKQLSTRGTVFIFISLLYLCTSLYRSMLKKLQQSRSVQRKGLSHFTVYWPCKLLLVSGFMLTLYKESPIAEPWFP